MVKWKKYNGALIPDAPPHIEPTAQDIEAAKKMGGYRFITYVTDFDCGEETPWWYVIKDTPLLLDDLPSKKRYNITHGSRLSEVRRIDCRDYGPELYRCFIKAQERYEAFRNEITEEAFLKGLQESTAEYYGVFFRETNALVAYAQTVVHSDSVEWTVTKYDPEYLKYRVSAALAYQLVHDYVNEGHYKYISGGQRAIRHKTNTQETLQHDFQFRRAYCRLHIIYSPLMKAIVTLLYPFRRWVEKMAGKRVFLNNVASVLKMEEIRRACRK